ncbi:RNA-binding protein [Candidatus Endobugula sertula]|uniref:RNA-binding protein n=1 Tax=Candidatus Endobugula sertula TaxID=62101 RepID=A0A1D2QN99_9GAMM|nr:RNA-binding protein [Candidatus Endobugula sertula]
MSLSHKQKKHYHSIGHSLNPIVTVAGNGLSDSVVAEVNRALDDHELIKIKVAIADRDTRSQVIQELCKKTKAIDIQQIGKVALILREAKKINVKLSNIR